MLNLVCIVVLFVFVCAAVTGLVGFMIDIHRFKADIEFSGNRKELLKRLIDEEELKAERAESEVTSNETEHCD